MCLSTLMELMELWESTLDGKTNNQDVGKYNPTHR